MLKPLLARSGAVRLVGPQPGRIDPRSLWTRLEAGRSLPPDAHPPDTGPLDAPPPGHALDLVTCTRTGVPGLIADHGHAWIRLVQPDGRYCSVGFFPDESTGVEPEQRPGLRMPGMLLSPDKYDRVGWNERSVRIHLTVRQHRELVAWIVALQAGRLAGSLAFDLVDRSCVGFVVRAANRVGVAVAASVPPGRFLGEAVIDAVLRRPRREDPAEPGRRRLLGRLRQAGYNLVLAALGGRATLPRQWLPDADGTPVLRTIDGIAPLFASWRDVLEKPVPFYHVRPLRDWQARVLAAGTRLEGLSSPAPDQRRDAQPPHRADAHPAGAGGDLHQGLVPE